MTGMRADTTMGNVVGYKLRRAQLAVFQDFHRTLAELDIRPAEFSVLSLIAATPGLKQTEIAEALGIKRANFVPLMARLEKRGLAVRDRDRADRRAHALRLTDEGERFVRHMTDVWSAHEQRIIERLGGEQERDRLIELLNRLLTEQKAPTRPPAGSQSP